MIKRLLPLLLAGIAFSAHASTITFTPNSQTINLGGTATVGVDISGLSANQALGAFDLLVDYDSSILTATSVTFFNNLGDNTLELTGSTIGSGSVEAAETSFEDTSTLLDLQSTTPFELFAITYTGVGIGTSSLDLGSSIEILADGSGAILADPSVTAGSITVQGGNSNPPPPPSTVPEPSSFMLLGSGLAVTLGYARRRLSI